MTVSNAKLAISYFMLAAGAVLLTRLNEGVALLWVANAPLIAHLCQEEPRKWRSTLLWVVPASILASALFGPVFWAAPFLAGASVAEAVVAAALLRRVLPNGNYYRSSACVIIFSGIAGVIAPLASGLLGATFAWLAFKRPWAPIYIDWAVGHGLGTLIATPIVMLLVGQRGQGWKTRLLARPSAQDAALILMVAMTTTAVFLQERLPLLFLPSLPILLATFKLGRRGAALSMALVAVIGWVATASGHGPIMMTGFSQAAQFQFFQFYLAGTFLMSLPIAGALEHREQLVGALETSEARHRRIVERSQDVIFETDAEGRWTFLSQAWVRLTGREIEASLGTRANLAIPDVDWPKLEAASLHARSNHGAIGQAEVRFVGADGLRWAAINLGTLRNATGKIVGTYGTIRDVTRRKRAEAEIADSEWRYRVLAENTSDMIARLGLDGCFWSVTPACRHLLGLTPEELVGFPYTGFVAAEDVGILDAALAELLNGGADQTCSYRHICHGADAICVESVFRLISDDDGSPSEFIVSVRDVSRRKALEAEAALALQQVRESNRLFSMAGTLASIGHWRFEVGGDSVIWSDEVFRIHGVDVGRPPPLVDAMNFYHPDDLERVKEVIRVAIERRQGFDFGARLIRADGSIRHVIAQGRGEFDEHSEMIAMFGVFQDVTERALAEATLRESEARFRLITEQAGDIIALIDLSGTCLFMSSASEAILGTPPEEMVGTRPIERVHKDDHAIVISYRAELEAAEGVPRSSIRFRMRRADGDYAWLEASSRRTEIDSKPCLVTLWRDVSHQVTIEAELKAAKAAAEAATIAKAGFLANMSHEIRTPMNGVVGFAELLLASDLTTEQRRDVSLIADSGKAMMKLLNDILDLSKIEAGQLEVVPEPFDLPHAVRACGKLLGATAAQKDLKLSLNVADNVPRFVLGDGLRVRQIVLNLLGNAIKFTERGYVSLHVDVVERDCAIWLAVSVEDSGIGITPERQGSIFEEFVQADHSITRRYGGSGLGLAISNRLAALMGGHITLTSAVGQGTVVTLLLPALAADEPSTLPSADPSEAVSPDGRHYRILLAEDHEVNQLLVSAMLARGGHTVVLAENGEAAVEAVRESLAPGKLFDLVLMDMQMPKMDGLAATRAIRSIEGLSASQLPIIALTANAFASDFESCRQAGMNDHIAKPVSIETLLTKVCRWAGSAERSTPQLARPVPGAFRPNAALHSKYGEHRARTLEQIDALIRRGTFTDEELRVASEMLHKLAGSAGMFGEASLGDRASELEDGLLVWSEEERASHIAAAAARLRDAA